MNKRTTRQVRRISHDSLPNNGELQEMGSLRDDGTVRWALTSVLADFIERLQHLTGSGKKFRSRTNNDRLDILSAALVEYGLDCALPEMIALTLNLRPRETVGSALAGLRRRFKERGLDPSFCYAGVEVPKPHHAHVMLVGVHLGTAEWKELIAWKRGRNSRLPRSVLQKWCYDPLGWRGYLGTGWNLGVPGARICHSTGELMTRARKISRHGTSQLIEKFEYFRRPKAINSGTFCGI